MSLMLDVLTAATHIYVSPQGYDTDEGSKKRPLKSLSQALIQARQASRRDTLFIHLADGVYKLDETLQLRAEDSGTAKSPTVIVAEHPGKAVISGGMELNLGERMESLNWWMGQPVVGHRTMEVRQLWRGGKKVPHASLEPLDSLMEVAGYSKELQEIWIPVENFDPVIDLVAGSRLGVAEDESIMKSVKEEEIRSMEMLACTERTMAVLRVKNYRIDKNLVKLTFLQPESRLLFSQQDIPLFFNMSGGYSMVFPGCWYQDPKNGKLVYDPEEEERSLTPKATAKNPFVFPMMERLLQVSGQHDAPVHHIIFRGLCFEYSAWNRPATSGIVTVPGGAYRMTGNHLERQEAAVVISNAHHVEFADCLFQHMGATAIDYHPGCTNGSVTGCKFSDIGGSAIATPVTPAEVGFRIQRNAFEDIANEIWFSDAIRTF